MVSFQCEGCGDTLTKKKLDGHRNQCRGAPFTCIDCMTTFQGTSYRAHTSCISEDQKYQGALYREKPSKAAKKKSVSIVEPDNSKALVPRAAYVEDAPDVETPPHVPTPPPAVPDSNRDSVFDYMVDDSTAGTPQISFAKDKGEMSMKSSAPSIFTNSRPSSQNGHRDEEGLHNQEYEEQGYTWGVEPVKPRGALDMNGSALSLEFMTPAAKQTKSRLEKTRPRAHSRTESSEKKRKRATDDQHHDSDRDMLVVDTSRPDTPGIVHSGLTGGLSRMITEDEYPFHREPDTVDRRLVVEKDRHSRRTHKPEDPTSPLKRTRHTKDDPNGLGISIKGRAVKALSMVGGALLPGSQFEAQQANTRVRRRASSSDHGQSLSRVREGEKRERKKHKVHRHNGTASANIRHEHRSRRRGNSDDSSQNEGTSRKFKAIEYRKHDDSASDSDDGGKRRGVDKAMVVFGEEQRMRHSCQNFLANAPGLESDKGYSIHKMLKRWHKQNDVRSTSSKADEESELWRALRIKRNERGEYVLVF